MQQETVMGVGSRSPQPALDREIDLLRAYLPRVMEALEKYKLDGEYPKHNLKNFRKRPIEFSDGKRRRIIPDAYVHTISADKDISGRMRDKDGRQPKDPRMAVPVWWGGIAVIDGKAEVIDTQGGENGVFRIADLSKYPYTWRIASIRGIAEVLSKVPDAELGAVDPYAQFR